MTKDIRDEGRTITNPEVKLDILADILADQFSPNNIQPYQQERITRVTE